jgi:hypothetical protein
VQVLAAESAGHVCLVLRVVVSRHAAVQCSAGVIILTQRMNSSQQWFLGTLITADDAKSSDAIPADRVPSRAIFKKHRVPKTMKNGGQNGQKVAKNCQKIVEN